MSLASLPVRRRQRLTPEFHPFTVKSIVPLHHGRMWLLMYTYTCIQPEDLDLTLPRTREFVRKSVESAIVILRWAVESRVWMPSVFL